MKSKFPKYALLPRFILTELCDESDFMAIKREIPAGRDRIALTYCYRPNTSCVATKDGVSSGVSVGYNLIPIVLDSAGALWDVAAIYILTRCLSEIEPQMGTYQSIAGDLSIFRRFLDERGIDYLAFPKFKLDRPTYRFNRYLSDLVNERAIAASSASRIMGSVINLYRFLQTEKVLVTDFPMWQDRTHFLSLIGTQGASSLQIKIESTDISVTHPKQTDDYDGYIDDGEKLRPLSRQEQQWIFEALAALQNPEMALYHALAITTGARIQTACTFKMRHIQREFEQDLTEIRLPIGPSTGIDTKYNKRATLHIPRWVYEALRGYAFSPRARERRRRAKGGDSKEQYVFLTQQGSPYYEEKSKTHSYDPEYTKRFRARGQTIRMFIRDRVIPWVQVHRDKSFHYRPHDLKATFGMNLTDTQ